MKGAIWTGRIISTLIILFMLFDGIAKVVRFKPYVDGTVAAGYPDHLVVPLGIIALIPTILYAIPRTSVLGAILLAAYWGGAVATHLRLGQTAWVMPVMFGVLAWFALWLREPRIRTLVPLRNPNANASPTDASAAARG